MKPRILVLVSYYLPGYLAGGPVRSIANLVDWLGDEFEFMILTSDRDVGAAEPYSDVNLNTWNSVGRAQVFYLRRHLMSTRALLRLIRDTPHSLLYLNSFFDPIFSIQLMLFRMLGLIPKKPVLLAPRGEFSKGALMLKYRKKRAFMAFARITGMFNNLYWQASTELEAKDIAVVLGKSTLKAKIAEIITAVDFSSLLDKKLDARPRLRDADQVISICYLSRISRMKNLDYALSVLANVSHALRFTIYGPQEDKQYWKECLAIISRLPSNVEVTYKGPVPHERVWEVIAEHDLLFVPTRGENFGHVFLEAWSAGVPVLTSDQTPWQQLEREGVGWDLSLQDPKRFVSILSEVAGWSPEQRADRRQMCLAFAERYLNDNGAVEASRDMFRAVIRSTGEGSH